MSTAAVPSMVAQKNSSQILTGATTCFSMSTSTETMGLGASQQTGWTGLVAEAIQLFGFLIRERMLAAGKQTAFIARGGQAGGHV